MSHRGVMIIVSACLSMLLYTTAQAEVYEQDTVTVQTEQVVPPLTVETDTLTVVADTLTVTKPKSPARPNSKIALLCSIIPGGGQIYNQQYWKLPIVIGAYTACYYAINWNNNALMEYSNAFRDIMSDKPMEHTSWQDFIPYGADPAQYVSNTSFHNQLRRGRDFYRRYRDLSIIVTAGVYLLVMIDAYVDAELSNFDISPNLTMQAGPAIIVPDTKSTSPQSTGLGLHLALTF